MNEVKIEWVGIGKVITNPDNPRTISERKMQELMDSISKFPKMLEYRPVIVDRETGHIIGGNQRHEAAKRLGWKQIPVAYIDQIDRNKLREFVIKDNLNFGDWDFDQLREFYNQDELLSWGLEDAKYVSFFDEEESEPGEDGDGHPEESTGTNYGATAGGFEENQIKKIVFNLNTEEYDKALDAITKYIKTHDLNDTSEALISMLEHHDLNDNRKAVSVPKHAVYVISAGRYNDLPFTEEQRKKYIFCVKSGEGELYKAAGCAKVYETGKLVESRNFALQHAYVNGMYCVQLSDDIKRARLNANFGNKTDVDLDEAITELLKIAQESKYNLIGIPPTGNDFFAKSKTVTNAFCIGDLFVAKPTLIRFDENLTLKEDYDYTLQHISNGGVMRYQKFIFEFSHYTNKGGAVEYRDEEEETRNIEYLKSKWGDTIRDNPKRKNEILLKIKK